jgi:hypothetical protein
MPEICPETAGRPVALLLPQHGGAIDARASDPMFAILHVEPAPGVNPGDKVDLAALRANRRPSPVDQNEAHALQREPQHNAGLGAFGDEEGCDELRRLKNGEGNGNAESRPPRRQPAEKREIGFVDIGGKALQAWLYISRDEGRLGNQGEKPFYLRVKNDNENREYDLDGVA